MVRWLICFTTVGATALAANCPSGGTTIFFGNGILTTLSRANQIKHAMQQQIDASLDFYDANRDRSCIQYKLAYDSKFVDTGGRIADGTNIVAQLIVAAVQLHLTDYSTAVPAVFPPGATLALLPNAWSALAQQYVNAEQEIAAPLQPDLTKQVKSYQAELDDGNNVVIVAHSQGALYANSAFGLLSVPNNKNVTIIGVASPADHVAGSTYHVTLFNDIILLTPLLGQPQPLPASLANENTPDRCDSAFDVSSRFRCHDFMLSYMTGNNSGQAITDRVTCQIYPTLSYHSEGAPNTLYAGGVSFLSERGCTLHSISIYLWVSPGFETSDARGLLLDLDNFNQGLDCVTDIRPAASFGAASVGTGTLTTIGSFHGTQCDLHRGHNYTVIVSSTDASSNHLSWGGYLGDGAVYYLVQ